MTLSVTVSRSQYSAVHSTVHSTALHSTGPGGGQLCAEPSCSAPRLSSRYVTVATRAHTQLYTQLLHTAFTHSYSYYRYSEESIGDHYPGCDLLPPPQCRGRAEDEVGYSPDKLLHSPRSDRAAAQRRRQPQQFLSSVTAG